MAVAFDSIVNIAPATGAGPVTTPAITMPGSNPVAILCVVLRHASATVSGTPTTTFGGVVSEIANVRTVNAGFEVLASIWRIVAPTANANGTASVTFTASVPYQIAVVGYSGAHQVTPCPGTDAQTDTNSATVFTLAALNVIAGDACVGLVGLSDSSVLDPCTPNNRFRDNTTTVREAVGDNLTDATGVTFSDGGGGLNKPMIAIRIAQVPPGPPGGSFTQQILRSRMREW